MGFNLGAFAGGFTKGMQDQQQIQQKQKALDSETAFRNVQMKTMQNDEDWKTQQRAREKDLQDQMKALHDQTYGEQSTTDDQGNVVKTPASQFGQDPAKDIAFTRKAIGLQMANNGDLSKYAPLMEYAQKAAASEQGKQVLAAMSGDQKAFQGFVTQMGGDPTKAKFNANGENGPELDLGNGQPPINIKEQLYSAGALDAANFLQQQESNALQKKHVNAQIGQANADTAYKTAETNIGIPARAQYYRNVGDARLQTAGARSGANTVSPQLMKMAQGVSTDPVTQKPDADMTNFILGEAAGQKNPTAAIADAQSRYRAAQDRVNAEIMTAAKAMSPKERAAAFKGITDLSAIRRISVNRLLKPKPFALAGDGGSSAAPSPEMMPNE